MELVNLLQQQLGINPQQASGGLGLLMGAAQEKLGPDFNQLGKLLPGVGDLIQQAPKPEGGLGAGANAVGSGAGNVLGMVGNLLGGKAGGGLAQLGNLAALAGGFKQLGLDTTMIGKFVPVVMGYFQNKGGDTAKALLERAMK